MPVHLTILGSGSSGNAAFLECGQTRILIDAGLSGRQIRQRLAGLGRTPETLTGILITHEHGDHIGGLGAIAAKLGVPIYCNRLTKECIETSVEERLNFRVFETGGHFALGDLEIDSFSIPHDAQDPVGFVIHTTEGQIGFLTDLGHATKLVVERVRHSRVLVLESNYDEKMLQEDTKRPWSTKQRIMSRHGHLSNEDAAKVLEEVMHAELQQIYLGHLSRDCNTPVLAEKASRAVLARLGMSHVALAPARQDIPLPTYCLGGVPV